MKYKILSIDVTNDCNLKCPWCIRGDIVKNNKIGFIKSDALRKLAEHIKKEPHETYIIEGGEPTLYIGNVLILVDYIKNNNPKAKIMLLTNGLLLNKEMVDELNKRNVFVCISANGSGYKSVDNLDIRTIQMLHNFCIREVFDCSLDSLYEDVIKIKRHFHSCNIELKPDYTTLDKWDTDTLIKLDNILHNLDGRCLLANTSFMGASDYMCDCSCMDLHFYVDGTFGRNRKYTSTNKINGCAMMNKLMDIGIYYKYQNILKKYYGGDRNEQ